MWRYFYWDDVDRLLSWNTISLYLWSSSSLFSAFKSDRTVFVRDASLTGSSSSSITLKSVCAAYTARWYFCLACCTVCNNLTPLSLLSFTICSAPFSHLSLSLSPSIATLVCCFLQCPHGGASHHYFFLLISTFHHHSSIFSPSLSFFSFLSRLSLSLSLSLSVWWPIRMVFTVRLISM